MANEVRLRGDKGLAAFLFLFLSLAGCIEDAPSPTTPPSHQISYHLLIDMVTNRTEPALNWSEMADDDRPQKVEQNLESAKNQRYGKAGAVVGEDEGIAIMNALSREWERQNPNAGPAPDGILILYQENTYLVDVVGAH